MSAQPIAWPLTRAATRQREIERERDQQLAAKQAIDRAADILDRLDERTAHIDKQIKRLQASKKVAQARIEHIEERVLSVMRARRAETFQGLHRAFTTRTNPARLIIDDETAIPREYLREKVITEPDKNAIKNALAQGADIGGVRLVQGVSLKREEI